jgi:hypothetical protein
MIFLLLVLSFISLNAGNKPTEPIDIPSDKEEFIRYEIKDILGNKYHYSIKKKYPNKRSQDDFKKAAQKIAQANQTTIYENPEFKK